MSFANVITSSVHFACADRSALPAIPRNGLADGTKLYARFDEARERCGECILVLDADAANGSAVTRGIAIKNINPYLEPVPVVAAGGFVLREISGDLEILLILRRGVWDLPKGKLDAGESIEECAMREVCEELGISAVTIERPLGQTLHGYRDAAKYAVKTTHWFAMTTEAVAFKPQKKEKIERVEWVRISDARDRLGFATLRRHLASVELKTESPGAS